jgi:hypothetical protein
LDGDIFEFGVYRGSTLLAMALLLKELGSEKKVYGFDSFYGFPSYSPEDNYNNFYNLKDVFSDSFIDELDEFTLFQKQFNTSEVLNEITLAESKDFSENNIETLKKKIKYFNLDNIVLIEGDFENTVPPFFDNYKEKIFSCNIDCDLYSGYKIVLPFVYRNLVEGGFIHLDEYFSFKYPGAKIACDEFAKKMKIKINYNMTRNGEFKRYFITK